MPRPPASVKGVYQRDDDPSGNWYARFRVDGKLVKKSFGSNRAAAIEYVEKARTLLPKGVDACGPQNEQRQKRLQHRIYELDVALGAGMRKAEQYGLCWSDIDFDRRVITLRATKNGSSRTAPMIDDVLYAFRQLMKLSLERKDRAIDRPYAAPDDVGVRDCGQQEVVEGCPQRGQD